MAAAGVGPDGVALPNSSGIKVIVVGLGVAGLTAAVECHRKGHTVIAFERVKEMKPLGDGIGIACNAARVISKWGGGSVHKTLESFTSVMNPTSIYDETGTLKTKASISGYGKGEGYLLHRGDLAMTLFDHVKSLGIDVRMGVSIAEYWETDTAAGVIVDGERIEADCVIAADGVHSKARAPITGQTPLVRASGRAIYRAWFESSALKDCPEAEWLSKPGSEGNDDAHIYLAKDIVMIMGTSQNYKAITWSCVHSDPRGPTERFYYPATADDVLERIKDWPAKPRLEAVIRRTPPDNLIDYPLLTCDPIEDNVSKHGRMILIGDATHPYLPTSGQGACQAIEDAAVVAIALELAGKGNVPRALQVFKRIRGERTLEIHKLGLNTLEILVSADWSDEEKSSKILSIPNPVWVLNHDCQKYTYEEYDKVAESIVAGTEYKPLNTTSTYLPN
ncbi:FAD binding domain-containing protein [Nannizzia gypsea CBS 118893]|uniref:FAD binding domain-containing protein n=1 Tax=Arthroderma gypseum (strain ATCC MYA-4604 / CBS 118893) TaxID=535722 RepID=E4UPH3_ARTGP|nr:FAD binding domain-containing protein [Nannizzia gypsea CBS 118893]EFQ99848.1 FAD binding domain-containing protein [Nannizzia gypsea CBS 118893]